MKQEISILIIEKEKTVSAVIGKFLEKKGYIVNSVKNIYDALKLLLELSFNFILINNSSDSELFINQVKEISPKSIIILALDQSSTLNVDLIIKLDKPINLIKLDLIIREHLKKNIDLSLIESNLVNFIKEHSAPDKKLLISILEPISRKVGLLYLDGYTFVHSEYDDLIAEDSLEKLLDITEGLVSYFDGVSPPVVTMNLQLEEDSLLTDRQKPQSIVIKENLKNNFEDTNKIVNNINEFKLEKKIIKDDFFNDLKLEKPLPQSLNYTLGKKLLVVDDDITARKIHSKIFQDKGFQVEVLDSVLKAKEILSKDQNFEFIVTDLNMPELSGIDLLLWVRENKPKIKVIIISAFVSEKIQLFIQQKGAVKYFKKPIDLKELEVFIDNTMLKSTDDVDNIEKIGIVEFIQLVSFLNQKKIIAVKNLNTNQKGEIYIEGDQVLHAEYNNLSGPDAFYEIMEITKGDFAQLPWHETNKISINASLDLLIKAKNILKKDEIISLIESKIDIFKEKDLTINTEDFKINNKKILIVDDDITSIKILNAYLQKRNYDTKISDSAIEGMEILKKETFDLVITDINMPKVNGVEFLLWIKQYFPRIKVIMMTAFGSEAVKNLSSQKGAFYFFEKPLNFKEVSLLLNVIFSNENINNDINLLDYLKLASVSKSNKLISITNILNNQSGYVYLNSGKILHAELGELKGYKAIEKILEAKNLMFLEVKWENPSEISIDVDTTELIENIFQESVKESNSNNNSVVKTGIKTEKYQNDTKVPTIVKSSENKNLELYLKQKEIINSWEKETSLHKRMSIYEIGICMGCVLGVSDKTTVIKNMEKFSNENIIVQKDNKMLIYQDISVTILFDDNNIVQELNFGKYFRGETYKGIKIGDFLKKGFDIYGKPDTCTLKGAVWKNLSLFSFDGKYVTSIRLRALD